MLKRLAKNKARKYKRKIITSILVAVGPFLLIGLAAGALIGMAGTFMEYLGSNNISILTSEVIDQFSDEDLKEMGLTKSVLKKIVSYEADSYRSESITFNIGVKVNQSSYTEDDLRDLILPDNFWQIASGNKEKTKIVSNSGTVSKERSGEFVSFLGESKQMHEYFKMAAVTYGIDIKLLKAFGYVESRFNPNSVSHVGAQGVMQLMPATARMLNVSNPFDPLENIMGGAKYIAYLLNRFDNNMQLAITAYNMGEGTVGGNRQYYNDNIISYTRKVYDAYENGNKNATENDITGSSLSSEVFVKYIYDGAEETSAYKLPWQFVYAAAVVENTKNTDNLTNGNNYNIISTSLVNKIGNEFSSVYSTTGTDYYASNQRSYSYAELLAGNHIKRADGDILIPQVRYNSISTYLYDYTFSYDEAGKKTVTQSFDKNKFISRLGRIGIQKDEIEWLLLVLQQTPNGAEIAEEIASAMDMELNIDYEDGGFGNDISGDVIWADPDSKMIPGAEYAPGGLLVPVFYQTIGKWTTLPIFGGTFASSGCGPTSLSMILSYEKGYLITPEDVWKWNRSLSSPFSGNGMPWSMPAAIAKAYGLTCSENVSITVDGLKKILDTGHPVLISMKPGTFTRGGHIMVLRGYRIVDGKTKFYVNDPNSSTSGYRTQGPYYTYREWPATLVVNECKKAWLIK